MLCPHVLHPFLKFRGIYQEFGFGFRVRTMACDEDETERLRPNKVRKKWKLASQSATKSQAPSVSELFRTLW